MSYDKNKHSPDRQHVRAAIAFREQVEEWWDREAIDWQIWEHYNVCPPWCMCGTDQQAVEAYFAALESRP